MNRKLLFIPLVTILLGGCGNPQVKPIEVTDVKTAILRLQQADNFSVIGYDQGIRQRDALYNENYYFDRLNENGYLTKNNGVYPFIIVDKKIRNKEIIPNETIYGSKGVIANFDDLDTDLIPNEKNTFTTKKRDIVMPTLEICGFDESLYANVENAVFTLDQKDNNLLKIDLGIKEINQANGTSRVDTYSFDVGYVGGARDAVVDEFLKNGTLVEIDPRLIKARRLIRGDNFTYFERDKDGNKLRADVFHEKYFVSLFTDFYLNGLNPTDAVMEKARQILDLTIISPNVQLELVADKEGKPVPLFYDDTYKFFYDGTYDTIGNASIVTTLSSVRPGFARGGYDVICRDISKVWHYPKYLKMFSDIGEFRLHKDTGIFYTHNMEIMSNFAADYNIIEGVNANDGADHCELKLVDSELDKDCKVVLSIVCGNGVRFDQTYEDFGESHFVPFDNILKMVEEKNK